MVPCKKSLLKLNFLAKKKKKKTICISLWIQLISIFCCSKGVDYAYEYVSTLGDIFKGKMTEKTFKLQKWEVLTSKFPDALVSTAQAYVVMNQKNGDTLLGSWHTYLVSGQSHSREHVLPTGHIMKTTSKYFVIGSY